MRDRTGEDEQVFIRIFITQELKRESLADSLCVCVCVAFVYGVISTGGVPLLPPRGRAKPASCSGM